MTILFNGGEMGAFVPSDASTIERADITSYYAGAFARCALICGNGAASQYAESAAFTASDELYIHCEAMRDTVASSDTPIFAVGAGATDLFRLKGSGTVLQMQALISAVWTNVGAAVTYDHDALQTIDVYIDGNSATGTAKLYLSGTLRETASNVDLSAVTAMTKVRAYGMTGGNRLSQMVVADEPTIGWRLLTVPLTGAGANSDFTGTFASIDEAVYSDADFIFSDTANDVSLFAHASTLPTGYVIRAIGVTARAKRGASGPQSLQLAIRATGANAFSSTIALDVGYSANCAIWETNPTTAVDWVNADFAALQFGVKAIA